ncbi:MAG TPA: hypothetical protein DE147_09950 [Gammaproteobacteria bacterium]|nr:hypothetical protein [Gammaproteobacteria bacterium]
MSFGFKAKSINGEGSKGRKGSKGSRVTLHKSERTTKKSCNVKEKLRTIKKRRAHQDVRYLPCIPSLSEQSG